VSAVLCSIPDGSLLDAACPECGHRVSVHARTAEGVGICGLCSTIEGELLTVPELELSTGVIIGAPSGVTHEMAASMVETLTARFPGVVFAVVPGVSSVAFNYATPSPDDEGHPPA